MITWGKSEKVRKHVRKVGLSYEAICIYVLAVLYVLEINDNKTIEDVYKRQVIELFVTFALYLIGECTFS